MSHHCHARGCTVSVPPEMLMCRNHWYKVPKKIRDAVWRTYRPGQCDDMNPSENWHRAADAAIGHVAWRECRDVTPAECAALDFYGFIFTEGA
jgi:hypothetical protein